MATILGFWNKKKNQSVTEQVLGPHIPTLYRFAYRLTQSEVDSEDLLQDLVIKLQGREQELLGLDKPGPWLSKALYRLYVDSRRRRQVRPIPLSDVDSSDGYQRVDEQPGPADSDPAAQHERLKTLELLQRHLSDLPDQQRLIVLMHDVEGYLQSDIADILSLPLGTVKSRLHRARRELRAKLAGTF